MLIFLALNVIAAIFSMFPRGPYSEGLAAKLSKEARTRLQDFRKLRRYACIKFHTIRADFFDPRGQYQAPRINPIESG
jgi:hypothetical protein